jgi:hypothetical protein
MLNAFGPGAMVEKGLILRAFSSRCGKSPNFLRFFGFAPLYLARNAVKSGFSLIR